jgi:ribosomal protein S12 methylthiotransferase accessory factor YcaO
MAFVLPMDLQLWLTQRASLMGITREEALLEALYEVQRRDQQDLIEASKAVGTEDLWTDIEREASARRQWQKRHSAGSRRAPGIS